MPDIDRVEAQRQIDAVLRRRTIFSIVWLAGIGSVIAIFCGLRAKRLIAQFGAEASGTGRVWWCLIVGGGRASGLGSDHYHGHHQQPRWPLSKRDATRKPV
jgi:hypothetical protein